MVRVTIDEDGQHYGEQIMRKRSESAKATVPCSGLDRRATVDEDGHYSFAVAL